MANKGIPVILEVAETSYGTLASISGLRFYNDLHALRNLWLTWVDLSVKEQKLAPKASWQKAWKLFEKSPEYAGFKRTNPLTPDEVKDSLHTEESFMREAARAKTKELKVFSLGAVRGGAGVTARFAQDIADRKRAGELSSRAYREFLTMPGRRRTPVETNPHIPLCPKCKVPTEYYQGALGYEAMRCPVCHQDIQEPRRNSSEIIGRFLTYESALKHVKALREKGEYLNYALTIRRVSPEVAEFEVFAAKTTSNPCALNKAEGGRGMILIGRKVEAIETTEGRYEGRLGAIYGLRDGSIFIAGHFDSCPRGDVKQIFYFDEKKALEDAGSVAAWEHTQESEGLRFRKVKGGLLLKAKDKPLWGIEGPPNK